MARKKKFIVFARNKRTQEHGLVTGKGHRQFGRFSALWISDPAEAREIDQRYGMAGGTKEVSVTTDQQYEHSLNNEGANGTRMDNIHHYHFGPQTSKAAEDFWKRYEKKKRELEKKKAAIKARRRKKVQKRRS